jgi:hypothetical protein
MQTLEQLRSGKLKGITRLNLSGGLTEFPEEIFDLAETLEILDLSDNRLSHLPGNFGELKKLKIVFFLNNEFTVFPEVLAKCPALSMVSFKSNKITHVPANAFPVNLQWLILTNNFIEEIPASIGQCKRLQKVAFAGNRLKTLPAEMAQCTNLELLRISANELNEFPQWLLSLPRLSWLAFAGNPFCKNVPLKQELAEIPFGNLALLETLGEGASGLISKAVWKNGAQQKEVAVKVFKGEVTSDGYPQDEMDACILAGTHKNLVRVTGKLKEHPENKTGLVLELIPPVFKNLAGPPSYETCTRDTFKPGTEFSVNTIFNIAASIADAGRHLHSKGIMHGDLYAHNTLIDQNDNTIFGDFGAATVYELSDKNAGLFERLDVRAFGCLVDDLLNQCPDETNNELKNALVKLRANCMADLIMERPSFEEIGKSINAFTRSIF